MNGKKVFFLKNAMLIGNLVSHAISWMMISTFSHHSPAIEMSKAWKLGKKLDYYSSPVFITLLILVTVMYEKPIRKFISLKFSNEHIDEKLEQKAKKRLLNEPFIFVVFNFTLWATGAVVYSVVLKYLDYNCQVVNVIMQSIFHVAMINAVITFFLLEKVSQVRMAPLLFPEGHLVSVPGTAKVSIRKKLLAFYFAGTMLPFIFLVSRVQWVFVFSKNLEEVTDLMNATIFSMSFLFMTLGLFLTLLVSGSFARPLKEISATLKEVRKGRFTRRVTVRSNDELGNVGDVINEMNLGLQDRERIKKEYDKKQREYSRDLEKQVEERTKELTEANSKLLESNFMIRATNRKIMDSLRYAQVIQESILPKGLKVEVANGFVIWQPKDVVGGDMYYVERFETGFVISVIDCTGHGVPGAFMTMIAAAGLRRVLKDEKEFDPAEILKRLNRIVKTTLQQDTEYAGSNDGLDAAVAKVDLEDMSLTYAGAKLRLALVNGNVSFIRGDKQSIGYKDSDLDFEYKNHKVNLDLGTSFYLYTDGFVDQLGGKKGFMLGNKRFGRLLKDVNSYPYEEQRLMLLKALEEYQGDYERQDDLTVVGFGLCKDACGWLSSHGKMTG